MDLSPGRVMEPSSVRAGRMLCVVDVEDIASSLNVLRRCVYRRSCQRLFAGNHLENKNATERVSAAFSRGIGEAMMLEEVVVVVLIGWGKRDATENLSKAGLADDGELLVGSFCGIGVGDLVDDSYEAVGIGALITIATDRGGDAVKSDVTEDVNRAGNVADAVGCGRPGKVRG